MPAPVVIVIDDDPDVRQSLRWLFESVRLEVAEFETAEDFLEGYVDDRPGCIIADVRMPGMGGLHLLETLRGRGRHPPVVMLTAHGDVPNAVRAMKAGAADFLEKPAGGQALIEKVQGLLRLDADRRAAHVAREDARERLASLTPRERQVLDSLVEGRSNTAVGAILGISRRTVETHRKRLLEKMGVSNAVELVRRVLLAREAERGRGATVERDGGSGEG